MPSKPESQRKKRQSARTRPVPEEVIETLIVENAQAVAAAHHALKVESEFAGYFNELGFRIDVAPDTSAEAVLALGNALLETTTQVTAGIDMPFGWQMGIYRNDEIVRVVSPGDVPSAICPNCRQEQRPIGPSCIVCHEALAP